MHTIVWVPWLELQLILSIGFDIARLLHFYMPANNEYLHDMSHGGV